MKFSIDELTILMPVIDAGIKAAGIQIFQNNGGIHIQSALAKIQEMANEAQAEAQDKEKQSKGKDD